MLNWGTDYDRKLVVYSLHSNSSAIYTLPKGIHDMVAYDQYAYLVVYDTYENTSTAISDEDNGIYRINLDDGSYEVIERDGNNDTDIHVISDDGIYIIQCRMNYFYQARSHVYFFDYATGDKKKLIVI